MNVHFHILFLDGVFCPQPDNLKPAFFALDRATDVEIKDLAETIATRITNHLRRKGYLREEDREKKDE